MASITSPWINEMMKRYLNHLLVGY